VIYSALLILVIWAIGVSVSVYLAFKTMNFIYVIMPFLFSILAFVSLVLLLITNLN
jgi:hypothetical protein